jgi:ribonuclease J
VTGYRIDHDVPGAAAILVETPDTSFCYSGDIRMHGSHPDWNHLWMKEMRAKKVDYLLMEGTTFFPIAAGRSARAPKPEFSEPEIREAVSRLLKTSEGAVFFNFYHRNLDRLSNLLEAGNDVGRRVVLEPATACLAAAFFPDSDFLILETDLSAPWAREVGSRFETIGVAAINQSPASYFIQNDFSNIFNLIDYNREGSRYVHSNGVPLGPFDPAYGSMTGFLEKLGVGFESVSISGHGDQESILAIVDEIKPKTLIPWHSMDPGQMIPNDPFQPVLRPELHTWYEKNVLSEKTAAG